VEKSSRVEFQRFAQKKLLSQQPPKTQVEIIMADPKLEHVKSWLASAWQDLEAAVWLMESPASLFGAVGFHSQQAVEKSIKAYLTWLDRPFEKTHSFVVLLETCLEADPNFEALRIAAVILSPYAAILHHPGDIPYISNDEAYTTIELAQQAYEFILAKMPQAVQG
jgi:HEPN domain-containing protein